MSGGFLKPHRGEHPPAVQGCRGAPPLPSALPNLNSFVTIELRAPASFEPRMQERDEGESGQGPVALHRAFVMLDHCH